MSPSRSILLVGEGNFSFSASASEHCSEAESSSSITATCLQHQEEALRHEGAATNIQAIKDSGGTVLFGVDCTKLAECASLQGRVFDRVVFNFPHCGRKSGVKKNRELLRKFFLSCVHVLAEDGEVHVSLCNGQGGTPADQPKREWHNSWQVAAMAAEAHLILSDVRPFESKIYQNYKCTGYRSQDKGFHLDKALLHVFTRSLPYTSLQTLEVEEVVEGEKVQYNVPAELSDYVFRRFLCSDSVHPVKLVQDLLLEGLVENWSVSMTTETIPILLTAKQLQACCCGVDNKHCYWVHLLQKDLTSDGQTCPDKEKEEGKEAPSAASNPADKTERVRSKAAESLRSACSIDVDPEGETFLHLLRPSLHPQMEELLSKKVDQISKAESHGENEGKTENVENDSSGGCNGVTASLFAISGEVFKNVPISLWAMPVFHQFLLKGVFPSESEPVKSIADKLEAMLAPYGVSLLPEEGGLCLRAQPMGSVGKVFTSKPNDNSHISITVSLNLDLLAVLLYSIPDWRVLWSHDPRFSKQFSFRPSPGTLYRPFSLFPEHLSFDLSFWTGSTWEERKFHAAVREASRGTVEQVKLIDMFSHPDLSQTSYCYRLIYHTHTHALSHTRALQFHKHLECLLTTRLQVSVR